MKKTKYDVAVVGVGVGANYGSALTYYAITETLKSMGKSVVLINKIGGEPDDIEISSKNPSYKFAKKHNVMTPYFSKKDVQKLNDYADTFVVGTDQVWGDSIASYAGEAFYLGFADENKRKISIAGSFGHFDDFSSLTNVYRRRKLFQRFNQISVRELDGVNILKNKYHVKSTQIIEPVFYVDNQNWYQLADESQIDTSEPYILTYILDDNSLKHNVVNAIVKELNLRVIVLPDGFENVIKGPADNYKYTPEDVIKLIRDATYIVTDSFHGTSFSLKFNKNFVSLVNPRRGVSRFDTLIQKLGDDQRIIKDYSEIINNPKRFVQKRSYDDINAKISEEVSKAKKWIEEALNYNVDSKTGIVEIDDKTLEQKVLNKKFVFGRSDINVIYSRAWQFSDDGRIVGYNNKNEYFWKVFGDSVFIYNENNKFTSAFKVESTNELSLRGSGRDNLNNFFLKLVIESDDEPENAKNVQKVKSYLTTHTFAWYRKSQKHSPLSTHVEFGPDGKILGMPTHASSKYWKISSDGEQLDFVKENGETIVSLKMVFDDQYRLKSKFGYYDKTGEEHVLVDKFIYEEEGQDSVKKLVGAIELSKANLTKDVWAFLTTRSFDMYKEHAKNPLYANINLLSNGTVTNLEGIGTWSVSDSLLILHDKFQNPVMTFNLEGLVKKNIFAKFRSVGGNVNGKEKFVLYLHRINTQKATPAIMFSRIELIQAIRHNKTILSWSNYLKSTFPSLELYIGRELKEYANNFVGGPADILIFPKNVDDISSVIEFAYSKNITLTILGYGSNILIRDGGIRGIVMNMSKLNYRNVENNILTVGAGASLIETSYYLLEKGKSGLEWANNIPGSIGGAVFMNAGANKDISGMFLEATVVDQLGNIHILKSDAIKFGHRYSGFMEHPDWVIVEAKLKISEGISDIMSQNMGITVQNRENKHALDNPSNGSTFTWWRSARIIQQAGLVGTRIGGVEVSKKFPNFFLNIDQGTAADYEALIHLVIAEVYKFSGFLLKPEVRIIGDDLWEATEKLKQK